MVLFHNPFAYLGLFLFSLFVISLVITAEHGIKLFKCRNRIVSILTGLSLGCGLVYFSHCVLINLLLGLDLKNLVFNPYLIIASLSEIADTGYYSINKNTVSGVLLWLIWVIEASILIIVPSYFCNKFSTSSVFCEVCGNWAQEDKGILNFTYPNVDELKSQFMDQNFTILDQTSKVKPEAKQYFSVDEEWCKTCEKTFTVSLRSTEVNNLDKEVNKTIFEDLIITRKSHELLQKKLNEIENNTNEELNKAHLDSMAYVAFENGDISNSEKQKIAHIYSEVTGKKVNEFTVVEMVGSVKPNKDFLIALLRKLSHKIDFNKKELIVRSCLTVASSEKVIADRKVSLLNDISAALGISKREFNLILESLI